jgi:hypothetical protein
MPRALPLLLALAIAGVSPAAARQQEDDKISRRLVALLFPGMAESIVEGMPGDVPDVLPDGATAVVSMKSSWGLTVVAEAPSFTAAERPRYERKLAAAGWKEAGGPAGGGGLMAAPVSVPKMYCRGDQMLSYSTQPQARGGSVFRVQMSDARRQGFCSGQSGERGPRSRFEDVDMPPLTPPDGARSTGTSGGGGGDHMSQTSRLETTLAPAAVEAHYTSLLTADGWKMESRAAAEGVSMTRFAVPADASAADTSRRIATLEALSLPGGDVMVTLRVIGPRDSWR